MAVVTVCDICRKEVLDNEGIKIKYSDWNNLIVRGEIPMKTETVHDARICNSCLANIKYYCKNNMRRCNN